MQVVASVLASLPGLRRQLTFFSRGMVSGPCSQRTPICSQHSLQLCTLCCIAVYWTGRVRNIPQIPLGTRDQPVYSTRCRLVSWNHRQNYSHSKLGADGLWRNHASWLLSWRSSWTGLGISLEALTQCLAHGIMGSSFIAYGAILAIMLLLGQPWLLRRNKSQEFFDSTVIASWGLFHPVPL